MTDFFKDLCAPHFWAICLTIVVMLLLIGAGVALRPLLRKLLDALIKRISGEHVVVENIIGETGGDVPKDAKSGFQNICDPNKCAPLMTVKAQQQRNITDIHGFGEKMDHLTDLFFKKLNFIQSQNAVILRAMMKNGQLNESDIPKESL